jgi:hypothetical protein
MTKMSVCDITIDNYMYLWRYNKVNIMFSVNMLLNTLDLISGLWIWIRDRLSALCKQNLFIVRKGILIFKGLFANTSVIGICTGNDTLISWLALDFGIIHTNVIQWIDLHDRAHWYHSCIRLLAALGYLRFQNTDIWIVLSWKQRVAKYSIVNRGDILCNVHK